MNRFDRIEPVALFDGAIVCEQPRQGYKFSVDALILAAAAASAGAAGEQILDLGTGIGIVLLALGGCLPTAQLVGLEIQTELAELARSNARLAGLGGRMTILHGDLCQIERLVAVGFFDLVVSNPPFFRVGQGPLPPDASRAMARFEVRCTLRDIVAAVGHSLCPTGRALLLYPVDRQGELETQARHFDLELAGLRKVCARHGLRPRQAVFELRPRREKGVGEPALVPAQGSDLILYGPDGRFTGELATLVQELRSRRTAGNVPGPSLGLVERSARNASAEVKS